MNTEQHANMQQKKLCLSMKRRSTLALFIAFILVHQARLSSLFLTVVMLGFVAQSALLWHEIDSLSSSSHPGAFNQNAQRHFDFEELTLSRYYQEHRQCQRFAAKGFYRRLDVAKCGRCSQTHPAGPSLYSFSKRPSPL